MLKVWIHKHFLKKFADYMQEEMYIWQFLVELRTDGQWEQVGNGKWRFVLKYRRLPGSWKRMVKLWCQIALEHEKLAMALLRLKLNDQSLRELFPKKGLGPILFVRDKVRKVKLLF